MKLSGKNVGFAFTGSFCMYQKVIAELKNLVAEGANVIPIFSFNSQTTDSRFGKAQDFIEEIHGITSNEPILTIDGAEPLGPKNKLDILIIAPCTGNTLSKLNNGITDTPVLMAAKGHLRNNKPLVLAFATNDALGANFKTIGSLFNTKNMYFVPFGQDDFINKPSSLVAHMDLIIETLEGALDHTQLQPVIRSPF